VRAFAAALALLALFSLTACDKGDYLGGAERAARQAVNGWDMWQTDAVQPHEKPMPHPVKGTVPVAGAPGFEQARRELAAMEPAVREKRAELVYRRFCHHCHGPNGDGRSIVGESFGVRPSDLRAPAVQARSDRSLYDHLSTGTDIIIPLAPLMTPRDRLLAIERLRSLADAPSVPLFERRSVEPVQ
jgi:hypothetical protein